MASTPVFVADAKSTDGTPEVVRSFRHRLAVSVIPGGLPSVGRNAGARLARTPYVLFLDADVELADRKLIERALEMMKRKQLHCVTTSIRCLNGSRSDQALYFCNNAAQRLSRYFKPFSTGMFMLFDTQRFRELGGFDEKALYAEDYLLSKKVACGKFRVVPGGIFTTNRRFQKMGHAAVAQLFLKTALNSWNDSYFLRDQHYWQH